ncbi:DUF2390 domain-containing protein [uncultured Shewanella sp.]|uniref:DUF2390 domain-containing protein n=1 Tax=uncultured Shewanella sp. TaxID=173975 RepID=UPI00261E777F|nr:DUF2390 domain-containing protein [uncultured Shewanella sp.]
MEKAHTHSLNWLRSHLKPTLWAECDVLYARDPKGYITLQDTYQLNVNLLLLAQWLDNLHIEHQSLILNTAIWSELNSKVKAHDQNALIPYRQHRRASKSRLSASQYQHMLKKELLLERQTQQFILTELDVILQHADNKDINITPIENINRQTADSEQINHSRNADAYLSLFS